MKTAIAILAVVVAALALSLWQVCRMLNAAIALHGEAEQDLADVLARIGRTRGEG